MIEKDINLVFDGIIANENFEKSETEIQTSEAIKILNYP